MRLKRSTRRQLSDVQSVLDTLLDRPVGAENASIEPPATNQLQRAIPRQPVDWTAKYRFHDDPKDEWRDCLISDISAAGFGLRLFDTSLEEVDGHKVELQVQLCGDVRNSAAGLDNDVRVGIELVDLAEDAASFVDSLKRSRTRW
ncbi:MAG TPA: hypothetical protein VKR27_07895 [Acidimicrobiales bacterium]|nr:hypothetical protein [Acidimicrobiales bacterium]